MNNVWRCEYSKHRMSSMKVVLLLFLWGLENTDGNRAIGEWTQWSACSASDRSGFQQRQFRCKYPQERCQDILPVQTRSCQATPYSIPDMANNYHEGLLQGSKNDLALVNHNFKELLVSSAIECALYCVRFPECSSMNIGMEKDPAHGLLVCQLNNATVDSEPQHLISINGFNYYSVMSRHSGD